MVDNKINDALNKDTDLTPDEYKAARAEAATNSKAQQIDTARVPVEKVSEQVKHRRIMSNFCGSQLNFDMAILDALNGINDKMDRLVAVMCPVDSVQPDITEVTHSTTE